MSPRASQVYEFIWYILLGDNALCWDDSVPLAPVAFSCGLYQGLDPTIKWYLDCQIRIFTAVCRGFSVFPSISLSCIPCYAFKGETKPVPFFVSLLKPRWRDGTKRTPSIYTHFDWLPGCVLEKQVTDAVEDWANGSVDNNGLLVKVEEESLDGRDLRFYSTSYSDSAMHALINVICQKYEFGGGLQMMPQTCPDYDTL